MLLQRGFGKSTGKDEWRVAADEGSHGNGDRSTVTGKFTATLGPQPPLARDAVEQIKAAALDAQSSPRNPCLSHYLYLMEWHIAAAANK